MIFFLYKNILFFGGGITASNQQRKLLITDARGAVVRTILVPAGSTSIKTDREVFAKGIYQFILDDGKEKIIRGVVKQ